MSWKKELIYGVAAGAIMGLAAQIYSWITTGFGAAMVELQLTGILLLFTIPYGLVFAVLFHLLSLWHQTANSYLRIGVITILFLGLMFVFGALLGIPLNKGLIWVLLFSAFYAGLIRWRGE